MSNLFIIGNGFDGAHRLPTSYNLFNEYLKKKYPESCENAIEVPCEDYYDDGMSTYDVIDSISFLRTVISETEGDDWSLLEEALGRLQFDQYISLLDLDDEEHDPYEIEDMNSQVSNSMIEPILAINDLFPEWIDSIKIDKSIKAIPKVKRLLKKPHLILNFNYTDTLEDVYKENNVFHIHGSQNSDIVFGHGGKLYQPEDFEACYPGAESALCEIQAGLKKDTSKVLARKETKNFMNSVTGEVDKVYSYGFSYGDVDLPYITEICNHLTTEKVTWLFNDFSKKEEIEKFKEKVENCGFKGEFGTFHVEKDSWHDFIWWLKHKLFK